MQKYDNDKKKDIEIKVQRQNLYYDNTLIISLGVFAKYNMATKYATGPPSPTGKQSQL